MMYLLKIEMMGFWHPGTGFGKGSHLDAITHRNAYQLPVLPGRTIKGLLRDAVSRWEGYQGHVIKSDAEKICAVDQLFGSPSDASKTWAGLLRFSDAGLPTDEANYLAGRTDLLAGLYRQHFSSAIEHTTGVAVDKSLRGIELVIPLTLYSRIELIPNAPYPQLQTKWMEYIEPALALIQAVGAHRNRGFGRASLSLEVKK